ncbi:type I glyceraldehyde-3-phosphate dehydrogenase [Paludibacteraceae bacterium OttesenSCG-928-F17]|nr:type I glyceraldehyde-3-phosphate dehydrogenase [Paludibacteraceae bacterium OttesenSCG-928-F17]
MMVKVAINGFGRIGRLSLRKIVELKDKELEVVAINDLTTPAMLAYLLKYDSIHGVFNAEISHDEKGIIVNGKNIPVYAQKNPADLPWDSHGIDIVLECTGLFTSKEKSYAHINAGAKRVIISAPAGDDLKTVVFNVNHDILSKEDKVVSCASCTTNCLAPVAKVLNDKFGILVGQMTTIHAYTNSQPLMDTPNPKTKYRASRAASVNIVPYTTGAAKAIGLVIPELKGKLDGSSQRVPVHTGSIVELFTILEKNTTVEVINKVMKASANESYGYTEDEIVSSDIIGSSYGSLFDATLTKIVTVGDKKLVKTSAWYDNEMSFVSQMIRTTQYLGKL